MAREVWPVDAVFGDDMGRGSPYRVKFDPSLEAQKAFDRAQKRKRRAHESAVDAERPWLRWIFCQRGRPAGVRAHLYVHGKALIGYSAAGPILGELLEIEGVRVVARGDTEFSVVFPVEAFPAVEKVVKPLRRPKRVDTQDRTRNFRRSEQPK